MNTPFYSDGLRFHCTGCSTCCRHEPGYVFLTQNDMTRLCTALGETHEQFIAERCHTVDIGGFNRLSLREKPNYDCIFWDKGGCSVYESRPLQCRTYPFWSAFLGSQEDWNILAAECPGANQGKLYSRYEIEEILEQRRIEPLVEGGDA